MRTHLSYGRPEDTTDEHRPHRLHLRVLRPLVRAVRLHPTLLRVRLRRGHRDVRRRSRGGHRARRRRAAAGRRRTREGRRRTSARAVRGAVGARDRRRDGGRARARRARRVGRDQPGGMDLHDAVARVAEAPRPAARGRRSGRPRGARHRRVGLDAGRCEAPPRAPRARAIGRGSVARRRPGAERRERLGKGGADLARAIRIVVASDRPSGARRAGGGFRSACNHDYPRAEQNLSAIVNELTSLDVRTDGSLILTLDDPELFKYPIAFMWEPGFWNLTDREAESFRAYLLKGGFAVFEDFDGSAQWANFEAQMHRVLPEGRLVRLDNSHQIFNAFFAIKDIGAIVHPMSHIR